MGSLNSHYHNPILGYSQKITFLFQNKNKNIIIKAGNVEKENRGIKLQFWRNFKAYLYLIMPKNGENNANSRSN
jgi:hypothetical protein